jgi:hypothetical protein
MSTLPVILCLALLLAQAPPPDPAGDRPAIVAAALDYAEGYYSGAPDRMTRAVSPLLTKRGLMIRPGVAPFLVQMNAEMLIAASSGGEQLPAADRHITAEALDVAGDIASARVFTAQFNDYLLLVKRDGRWQLVSVLWHPPLPATAKSESGAAEVERAVRAYAAGLVAADAGGLAAVLHPLAALRTFGGAPGRPRILIDQNAESLVAGLAAGQVKMSGNVEGVQVVVQGVDGNIAAAKLTVGATTAYLHLAKPADVWRVVNTLTVAGGSQPR